MVNYFDLSYISNKRCRFFGYPSIVQHNQNCSKANDYQSRHGRTNGDYAPSECGKFWYRFFRKDPTYVELKDVEIKKMKNMRHSIALLQKKDQRPLIFKNLYNSVRLTPLNHYLDNPYFIVIKRNPLDNAHSLLEGRFKVYHNYNEWWSLKPPNYEKIKDLEPHEQVIGQIDGIYRNIEKKKEMIGKEKFLSVSYEELTTNPTKTLEDIGSQLEEKKVLLKRKRTQLPEHFKVKNDIRIDKSLYNKLVEYYE